MNEITKQFEKELKRVDDPKYKEKKRLEENRRKRAEAIRKDAGLQ